MEISTPTTGKTILVAVLVVVFLWWVVAGPLATLGAWLVLAAALAVVGYAVYVTAVAFNRRVIGRMEGRS